MAWSAKLLAGDLTPIRHTIAPPVQNTWYTQLTVNGPGKLHGLVLFHDNTDNTAKNIDLEVTLDGLVYTNANSIAIPDNTGTWMCIALGSLTWIGAVTDCIFQSLVDASFSEIYGDAACFKRYLRVRYRMTSVPGAAETMTLASLHETLS